MEVLEDLVDKIQAGSTTESYCVLVLDEMKIKEYLVYNKHTGNLVGYVNLGNVENQLLLLEENKKVTNYVATHMLTFMIRGISTSLNYPLAHFATTKFICRAAVSHCVGSGTQPGKDRTESCRDHSRWCITESKIL